MEHKTDNGESSAIAEHCISNNHNVQNTTISILHPATKGCLLNRLEEIETYTTFQRNPTALLNNMLCLLMFLISTGNDFS